MTDVKAIAYGLPAPENILGNALLFMTGNCDSIDELVESLKTADCGGLTEGGLTEDDIHELINRRTKDIRRAMRRLNEYLNPAQ